MKKIFPNTAHQVTDGEIAVFTTRPRVLALNIFPGLTHWLTACKVVVLTIKPRASCWTPVVIFVTVIFFENHNEKTSLSDSYQQLIVYKIIVVTTSPIGFLCCPFRVISINSLLFKVIMKKHFFPDWRYQLIAYKIIVSTTGPPVFLLGLAAISFTSPFSPFP